MEKNEKRNRKSIMMPSFYMQQMKEQADRCKLNSGSCARTIVKMSAG